METLSGLGVCHVTIIGEMVYKKYMIFEVFEAYLSEFLIFLYKIFLVARSYRVLVINMGALVTLERRLKVPILAVF